MSGILFSQVREDPMVELRSFPKSGGSVLVVGSGGCTVFSLLSIHGDEIENIDVIDLNMAQLYLIQLKLAVMAYYYESRTNEYDYILNVLRFFEGRLSKRKFGVDIKKILMMKCVSVECFKYWVSNMDAVYFGINRCGVYEQLFRDLVKSRYDFKKVFGRENLIEKFSEAAVSNSKENEFSEHFRKIMVDYVENDNINKNYFYHQIERDCYDSRDLPIYFANIKRIIKNMHKINYIHDDLMIYVINCSLDNSVSDTQKKYSMVQTSNITDWMNGTTVEFFLKCVSYILKDHGVIVSRRLNGDYNLNEIMEKNYNVMPMEDKSRFYKECCVGTKRTGNVYRDIRAKY